MHIETGRTNGLLRVGCSTRPFPGEIACGDACGSWQRGRSVLTCIVDGVGHGEEAEEAARAAIAFIGDNLHLPVDHLFADCDDILHGTRGVSMGLAEIDLRSHLISYSAVGNTAGVVVGDHPRRLSGNHGIVGSGFGRIYSEQVRFEPGEMLVMFTDGVDELIDISKIHASRFAPPQDIAAGVISSWGRLYDDAGVIVAVSDA